MLRFCNPILLPIIVASTLTSSMFSQTLTKKGTAQISGRITVKEKPAANIDVFAYLNSMPFPGRTILAHAATDQDGRYVLSNLPSGTIEVSAFAPTMANDDDSPYSRDGKSVTLGEGEIVTDIDFRISPGGVISGRVLDSDGSPLIGQPVRLWNAEKSNIPVRLPSGNPYMLQTDDRGAFRIYGVPPGRYYVGAGTSDTNFGFIEPGPKYLLTYHPSATNRLKAEIVEVIEGSENSNVDIQLNSLYETFAVTGRVVDADSGKPVPNIRVEIGGLSNDKYLFASPTGGSTNADGQFRIEGVSKGRHGAYATPDKGSSAYSDSAIFEVQDGDVGAIEVKVHQGSSISGTVAIEGNSDPHVLRSLSNMRIGASPFGQDGSVKNSSQSRAGVIDSSGNFAISGLPPGRLYISLQSMFGPEKGFTLKRVEKDGAPLPEPIVNLSSGEPVTGLRVVVHYGSGSVRGSVTVEGVTLPSNARLMVAYKRLGERPTGRLTAVDSRGHFLIEGLTAGDYEFTATYTLIEADRSQAAPRLADTRQVVSVTDGTEAQISLILTPRKP
jgi:5-hydroxyisourate hydrolase-like protein (transthyretin family)